MLSLDDKNHMKPWFAAILETLTSIAFVSLVLKPMQILAATLLSEILFPFSPVFCDVTN